MLRRNSRVIKSVESDAVNALVGIRVGI